MTQLATWRLHEFRIGITRMIQTLHVFYVDSSACSGQPWGVRSGGGKARPVAPNCLTSYPYHLRVFFDWFQSQVYNGSGTGHEYRALWLCTVHAQCEHKFVGSASCTLGASNSDDLFVRKANELVKSPAACLGGVRFTKQGEAAAAAAAALHAKCTAPISFWPSCLEHHLLNLFVPVHQINFGIWPPQ